MIAYDSVVQSILHTAEKEEVDLIALASHGRSGLARAFYGSVASGVLNRMHSGIKPIHLAEVLASTESEGVLA